MEKNTQNQLRGFVFRNNKKRKWSDISIFARTSENELKNIKEKHYYGTVLNKGKFGRSWYLIVTFNKHPYVDDYLKEKRLIIKSIPVPKIVLERERNEDRLYLEEWIRNH